MQKQVVGRGCGSVRMVWRSCLHEVCYMQLHTCKGFFIAIFTLGTLYNILTLKCLQNQISQHFFLGGMPPDPLILVTHAECALIAQ